MQGVFCHNCGKEGHVRPFCRFPMNPNTRFNQSRMGTPNQATSSGAHVAETFSNASNEYSFITEEIIVLAAEEETWLGDSASQSHIVRNKSLFTHYIDTPGNVIKGAGSCLALGKGDVHIDFLANGKRIAVTLKNAIHAPDMPYNLISLGCLTSSGLSYTGHGNELRILDHDLTIGIGQKRGNLYAIAVQPRTTLALAAGRTKRSWFEWHCALSHINKDFL